MDYDNPITQELIKRRWTNAKAAEEIYKKHKKEFQRRNIAWTADRFTLVKLGHCEAKWLRQLLAKFFGINEEDIPRRDKRTKRARDEAGNQMNISGEARRKAAKQLQKS
ncbi:MAG: hypothetical protein D8M57_13040 [Candidatus Scalindua sp. AMX11]|nr:MAG: hypothetical protein DWQ00_12050 [Candidatus Scalindua sp.]NOG83802.1 hypothetical protein [Planctomycetota bacterium]RZV82958.1 MAG: hypothetical protein EX341_09205 [Candidatus Scalindua sp. SCAELEC01]TDE64420.1 MAG: hypothetical protein D8M57_13040 [Candidatus Scalindua sp. AMX11]GJQ59747.1 MAG: hypothetical protein SCALA701_25480 [Candidatus Scalindua sp.]